MIKNFLKSLLRFVAEYKDKNQKNLKELLEYNLEVMTSPNLIDPAKINEIIVMLKDLKGTSLVEGISIIDSVLNSIEVDGDVCEFGVAQGKTTKLISYLIKNTKKRIYLFDSFMGLPAPSKEDVLKDDIFNLKKMSLYEGKMSHSEKKVLSELNSINFDEKKIILNKGFFNQKNKHLFQYPQKISFAYIDFDFYLPTKDVLNVIENKLVKNSSIIIDDYDFFSTGVKTAVDEWLKDKYDLFEIKKIKTINSSFISLRKK